MIIQEKPLIFNIRSYALDDGPGIRTMVFFKGCNLACQWCHNPESISPLTEIAFFFKKCIGCGDCYQTCPEQAIHLNDNKRIIREKCTLCKKCAAVCPSNAIAVIGKYYEPDELIEQLLKDQTFYATSGGGVTFSGGEPTLYMDYLSIVMKGLKEQGIHLAIQTNGLFNMVEFKEKILPYTDLVFFDLKIFDLEQHKHYTGKSNKTILENITALVKIPGLVIIPRMPLVPGITDTEQNKTAIQSFLHRVTAPQVIFLPYNPAGEKKKSTQEHT